MSQKVENEELDLINAMRRAELERVNVALMDALPEGVVQAGDVTHLRCVHEGSGKGETYYYKDSPILWVGPLKIETIMEDGKSICKTSRQIRRIE